MKFRELELKGAFEIELAPMKDERGFFVRSFCKKTLSAIGFDKEIVQINHSHSSKKGTFRGFHFQHPPYCETKIIRCIRGEVYDIIIDIRAGSPTFLQSATVHLSFDKFNAIYIPEGFAHGFQTLTNNCELLYLHTAEYSAQAEDALHYADPAVAITLPLEIAEISARDQQHDFLTPDFKGINK